MRWGLVLSFAGLVAIGLFLLSGFSITSLPGYDTCDLSGQLVWL